MAQVDDSEAAAVWLDLAHEQLWRGGQTLHLRPKSFALLRYLVAHAGRVVSKDELVQAVWPETAVSDGVLTVSITEIRQVLGDTAQAPQYLETVPRRGYRWLGTLPTVAPPAAAPSSPLSLAPPPLLVGREADVAQLHDWLAQARRGVRQVGFVTGEAGLGKTTVVDAFVAQVAGAPALWLARGQCVEYYGAGEAYRPVLEALGQLCRGVDSARLVAWLAQHAPTWLVQMPALLSAAALEAVQRRVQGATRESMLRELAEALEALTVEQPLVLVLEDLHWSDAATMDLVGALARRRVPARLLLLGTYRPVEVIVREHPLHTLKLDLTLHRQCAELPLQLLSAVDVAQYLAARFGEGAYPAELVHVLHQRTDGHPLFLVTMVDALVQQGLLREVDGRWAVTGDLTAVAGVIPESLRVLLVQQYDMLSPAAQRVLEAASVAGLVSPVAVLAAGVETTDEAVETECAVLAQRGQWLQAHGVEEWPDGTVTARYGFRHTLYQQVLYDRVPVARRLRLHRQIGARLETGYGAQAGTQAAELAMHFDRGRDMLRAVTYLQQAATNALRRWAYAEAIGHLRRGLAVLPTLPDTRQRRQQELAFHLTLGQVYIATKGLAAPEVGEAYAQAQALCAQVGEVPQQLSVLRGLRRFHLARGEFQRAQTLSVQCLSVAERLADPALLAEAHAALGVAAYYRGELPLAQTHFAQGRGCSTALQPHAHMAHYGQDPEGICLTFGALTDWLCGTLDAALALMHQALAHAHTMAYPFGVGMTLSLAAMLHLLRGDIQAGQTHAEATITLTTAQGLDALAAQGLMLRGWALAAQGQHNEGLAQMRQGWVAMQTTGQEVGRLLYLAVLAEQCGQAGQVETGLHVLTEALASLDPKEPRLWEPELYRVRGTLCFQAGVERPADGGLTLDAPRRTGDAEAEICFRQALALARRQGAKAFELRAVLGLSRLWQRQGKRQAARQLLGEVYGGFTEGFDTADLREAKALLDALGA
jgi:predicted ATPase/DNA-binding winged helix-turn-helix (wHTH) protein